MSLSEVLASKGNEYGVIGYRVAFCGSSGPRPVRVTGGLQRCSIAFMITSAMNYGHVADCACPVVPSGEEQKSCNSFEYDFTETESSNTSDLAPPPSRYLYGFE